jgi:hypothetical protein
MSKAAFVFGHEPTSYSVSPLGAVGRGLLAGFVGTLAMDAWLYANYRRTGGREPFKDWEFSSTVTDWAGAPAPAQLGRRVVEGVFERKLPGERAALVNNVTHWGFGVASAASYGVLAGSVRGRPPAAYGLLFGAGVWLGGYAVLPLAGLYKPIWEYDAVTLGKDLLAHLVYGVTTGVAYGSLLPPATADTDEEADQR